MEKGISYLNRDFDDYKIALERFTQQYYPDIYDKLSDASVGSWLIDINADIADNLSYHIDRVFQETNINSASEMSSVMSIARNLGFKVPGPKASVAEVRFSCLIPSKTSQDSSGLQAPNTDYAPIIKMGTIVSSGSQNFELMYEVDFSKQFNVFGVSDRTIEPVRDSNGNIVKYKISKLAVVCSGTTRIYSKKVNASEIHPFMEILLPGENIMEVVSVISKPGTNHLGNPKMSDFLKNEEYDEKDKITRFFETGCLSDQYRWGETTDIDGKAEKTIYKYTDNGEPVYSISKGEWKPLKHKFITEYTDKGFLKIIFGSGVEEGIDNIDISEASSFSKYQMTKMIKNSALGYLPNPDSTIYVMYRVGGGRASNVPKGAIKKITLLNAEVRDCGNVSLDTVSSVKNSILVENTTPSVSGKDMPNAEELKNMIKYYNGAQERCVTLKDYKSRIMQMPPEYGMPFRIGVCEENNKVMIYLLGLDYKGNLSDEIPELSIRNIEEYLNHYRSINDFVEIKAGKIINIGFEVTVHTDRKYSTSDIKDEIRKVITDYLDVNKREMGDDVYIGDIMREISNVGGVKNLISLEAYNITGPGYSPTQISQPVYSESESTLSGKRINLEDSENILYSEGDAMLELKNPIDDIIVVVKPI